VGVGVGSGPRTASMIAVCFVYRYHAALTATMTLSTHGQTEALWRGRQGSRYMLLLREGPRNGT